MTCVKIDSYDIRVIYKHFSMSSLQYRMWVRHA